jgi:hypothetical protein
VAAGVSAGAPPPGSAAAVGGSEGAPSRGALPGGGALLGGLGATSRAPSLRTASRAAARLAAASLAGAAAAAAGGALAAGKRARGGAPARPPIPVLLLPSACPLLGGKHSRASSAPTSSRELTGRSTAPRVQKRGAVSVVLTAAIYSMTKKCDKGGGVVDRYLRGCCEPAVIGFFSLR